MPATILFVLGGWADDPCCGLISSMVHQASINLDCLSWALNARERCGWLVWVCAEQPRKANDMRCWARHF